jgi:hypothetical protein
LRSTSATAGISSRAASSTRSSGNDAPSRKEKADAQRSSGYGGAFACRGAADAKSRCLSFSLRAPAETMEDSGSASECRPPQEALPTPMFREGGISGTLPEGRDRFSTMGNRD